MTHEEKIKQAKQYLSDEGYGTGSNFGLLTVASLMVEFADKFGNSLNSKTESGIPPVVERNEQFICPDCNKPKKEYRDGLCEMCHKWHTS